MPVIWFRCWFFFVSGSYVHIYCVQDSAIVFSFSDTVFKGHTTTHFDIKRLNVFTLLLHASIWCDDSIVARRTCVHAFICIGSIVQRSLYVWVLCFQPTFITHMINIERVFKSRNSKDSSKTFDDFQFAIDLFNTRIRFVSTTTSGWCCSNIFIKKIFFWLPFYNNFSSYKLTKFPKKVFVF